MGEKIVKKIKGMSWTTKISLMLVFTLILSVAIYGVHTYKLRKAEAASGDVILLWDTANGAVPGGWTNISGLVGDPFYGVFPRAAASYGAATAGADTHTHSLTYSSTTGPSATTTTLDVITTPDEATSNTHTHTWGDITSGAGDVRPPFKNLIFIRATNPVTIPANAIGIFDTGSLPSGWTRYAALDGNYLRGFSDNATGGAATHTHTAAVTSAAAASYILDSTNDTSVARNTHTHNVSGSLSTLGTNAQPYVEVVFAYNSSGGAASIPTGLIAMFDAAPTGNWSIVSNAAPWTGNFLKGATSYGTTGGSSVDHNHGASQAFTSGGPSAVRTIGVAGARLPASDAHTHGVTYSIAISGNPLPVYRNTIFAKYTAPANTTTLSTGTNPGNSTIAPGGAITSVNGFTLTTSAGTDAITTITVNLSTNSGVGTLTITDGADSILGSIGGGIGTGIVTGDNSISITSTNATTGGTAFKVKVTPLSHANMPAPAGGAYAITGVVNNWTGTNTKAGQATDTSSTVTIDNASPAGTTGANATSGESTQSTVSWTNPGDADFQQVYIYCKTSSMISGEAPAEGTDPTVDGAACDGTARLKYKGTASPQIISSLSNGTTYYFRIYGRDTNGNFTAYAATQQVSGTPAAPANGTLQFTSDTFSVTEDAGPASATVSRTGGSSGAVSVDCATVAGGTATAGTDYTSTNTTLIWADADTAIKTCSIPITIDTADETNETVNLQLSNATGGATIGAQSTATLTINDDDLTPSLSINNVTLAEGNSGTTTFAFTVTLSAASGLTVTVDYATADNTATTADSDYTGISTTTLTYTPGQTTKTVNVLVNGDTTDEPNETFYVDLSNPGNATISDNQGLGTINNDDGGPLPSAITSCAGCHTYPPTDGTQRNTPEGAVVGSHSEHSYICSSCHVVPVTETSVDFKHRNSNIQFQGAVSYSKGASFAQTNDLSGAGLGNCNTATCHNAYGSSGIATPIWGQNVTCTSCHAIAGDGAPNTGSHSRHMSLSGALCNQCHAGAVKDSNGGTGHIDNNIDVANNNYTPNVTKHTSGSGYSTCSTIYCHSNVQNGTAGGGPTSYGTPTWGATPPLTCSTVSCHGNAPATPTANNAHGTHTTGNYTFVCSACHNNGGDESANHANGTLNMNIDTTSYGATAAYSQGDHTPGSGGYGTCATVYCHGNYTGSGGASLTPSWAVAVACGDCHKYLNTDPPTPGNHGRHAGQAAGQLNLTCANCHELARVLGDGHVNLSVQWNLDRTDTKIGSTATYKGTELGATELKAPSAAYGNCGSVYCHSSVQSNPGTGAPASYATPTWGAASVTCDSCHGQGAHSNGQPSTGSHEVHVTGYTYACSVCHSGLGDETATHANRTINLAFDAATAGGSATYTGDNVPQSGAFGNCTTTFCHGDSSNTSAEVGNWGTSLSASDACTVCHGTKTTPAADGSASATLRAPGGNATGVDTNGTLGTPVRNVYPDPEVGAHDGHLRGVATISNAILCTGCHAVPAVTVAGIKGHLLDGTPANMTFSGLAITNSAPAAFDAGTHTCSNVYCHNENYFSTSQHTNAGSDTTPTWNDQAYFGDNVPPLTGTECGRCHFYDASNCKSCHSHVNADNLSFGNPALHIDGLVQGAADCIGCHAGTQGTRRAIKTEFGLAFGHHDATVTNADCAICHMEATSATTPTRSALHAGVPSGIINLRDPDAGTEIASGASIFARNLGSNTLEAFATSIQNNLCLKCHDSNGANYLGAGQTGTDGLHTPSNPFVTSVAPVNVNAHFDNTVNASFHPVRGVQNNSYCDLDTMEIPWNVPNGTHKLITCFDCHAASGASGNQTSTVVAHGNAVTLRATYDSTAKYATKLCVVCHKQSVYWGTDGGASKGQGYTHMAANNYSALNGSSGPSNEWVSAGHHDLNKDTFNGCTICHGTTPYGGAVPGRPTNAINAHGFNTVADGTSTTWPNTGVRPFGFMRCSTNLTHWDYTIDQCGVGTGGSMCGRSKEAGTYTPGGTY